MKGYLSAIRYFTNNIGFFFKSIFLKNFDLNANLKYFSLNIEPKNSIEPGISDSFAWRSLSNDPWFLLRSRLKIIKGWYSIELLQHAEINKGLAKIYINYGNGYNEKDVILIPFENKQRASRVFRLKKAPKSLRLDPVDCTTSFSIDFVRVCWIYRGTAKKLMLAQLTASDEYKSLSTYNCWKQIKAASKIIQIPSIVLLYRKYNNVIQHSFAASSYHDWITNKEKVVDKILIKKQQLDFSYKPLISILLPTYNTKINLLKNSIESVLTQSYGNWQLCIADDASTNEETRALLRHYMNADPRIQVAFREANGHISAATNTALELAVGEYVALLDHDDELAVHALHYLVKAINEHPDVQVIYTDEDKIDDKGRRFEPHFKSDWNLDMFLSQNYVSHLGLYRRDLVNKVCGFERGLEGSQDYDLLLRCLSHIDHNNIIHIPKVLYHWRSTDGSTAKNMDQKPYSGTAALKALKQYHLREKHESVIIEPGLGSGTYRTRYLLLDPKPLVSIIIPTRDGLDLLANCINSILKKNSYTPYEIIIINNKSEKNETHQYLQQLSNNYQNIKVISYPKEFNYSAINNFGARVANGKILGLLNNDVIAINDDWLTELVSHAARPEIGCVGAKLYYEDGTIQHGGVILGLGGVAGHSHKHFSNTAAGYFRRLQIVQNLSAVTGACMFVKKAIFFEVGGLDENLKVAFNDIDFCLKVREAGYRNLWTPYAELYHLESKSRGYDDTPKKKARFDFEINYMKEKWRERLIDDPFYNINLTKDRENFSIEGL